MSLITHSFLPSNIPNLRRLLLAFPELKNKEGLVLESLKTASALPVAIAAWSELVEQEIELESDEY